MEPFRRQDKASSASPKAKLAPAVLRNQTCLSSAAASHRPTREKRSVTDNKRRKIAFLRGFKRENGSNAHIKSLTCIQAKNALKTPFGGSWHVQREMLEKTVYLGGER